MLKSKNSNIRLFIFAITLFVFGHNQTVLLAFLLAT
jgi:hypothetical protein